MSASLVGSEMCIRDSMEVSGRTGWRRAVAVGDQQASPRGERRCEEHRPCLLYTSDAADDM
eukprot:5969563-Alexandrium_andersonii.AAC.1